MRHETAVWVDAGGRQEQQDRAAVFESDSGQLLVVADGLGGHEAAEQAAQAVIDAAHDRFKRAVLFEDAAQQLGAIVDGAHRRIQAMGLSAAGRGTPHSTCVLLYVGGGVASWAHVGDSRLYRFENGRLAARTTDHSVVEMMRLEGRITEEEMKTHPNQIRLYDCLGGARAPSPDFGSKVIEAGDAFLLASDGIWAYATNAQLEAVFKAADLAKALRELVARAKAAGGPTCDNLAVAGWRAVFARGRKLARVLGVLRCWGRGEYEAWYSRKGGGVKAGTGGVP